MSDRVADRGLFPFERPLTEGGPALLFEEAPEPPSGVTWLGPDERRRLAAMRFEKRRRDFVAGRWVLHRLLARELLDDPVPSLATLARIDVRATNEGVPEAFLDDRPAPCAVSLSHREGGVLAAVAHRGARLGCDLEWDEPRSAAFIDEFLAPEEVARVRAVDEPERSRLVNLYWTAKESALKAVGVGLRIDARAVVVRWHAGVENAAFRASLPAVPSSLEGAAIGRGRWLVALVHGPPL